jgi:hypothetical protein
METDPTGGYPRLPTGGSRAITGIKGTGEIRQLCGTDETPGSPPGASALKEAYRELGLVVRFLWARRTIQPISPIENEVWNRA